MLLNRAGMSWHVVHSVVSSANIMHLLFMD